MFLLVSVPVCFFVFLLIVSASLVIRISGVSCLDRLISVMIDCVLSGY